MLSTTTAATISSKKTTRTTTKMMMMTKCHRPQRCQIQYHNGRSSLPSSLLLSLKSSSLSSLTSSPSSFYGLNKWLWTAVLFGLLIVTASAIDENSKLSPASTVSSSLSPRDEIYIDDEGLDGSGRGGLHDD
ncbi:syndecan-like [Lucilia sericata]|uniref:syndecan-like n=1 Tax=Lucilia sericata TaxID=13632 RepID=UPI0018A8079E|nr:syndecan-like [Lucilia sericata]